jgi:hypothetical protein
MDVQVEEIKEEPKPEISSIPITLPELGDLSNEQLLASFFSRGQAPVQELARDREVEEEK